MTNAPDIPRHTELMWTALCAVRELGHSARLDEIDERVIEREGFSEEQLAALHNEGPRTELKYRLAWARTFLKGIGALEKAGGGTWETTPLGRTLSHDEMDLLFQKYKAERGSERKQKKQEPDSKIDVGTADDENGEVEDWKEQLLAQILQVSPLGFEHLTQRLLRAAGFINTTVTGRSGDGGIDGVGVYRLSLVSFPIFFQCKRYKGSVGPDKVRDFRGAMSGRGDKGLLITTGAFTREARNEATRDGAPPIDLIDGEQLCILLKEHQLGVRTEERRVEEIKIVNSFFEELA